MVLVVEDDRATRETLSTFLKIIDKIHEVVATSEEAIRFLKSGAPTILMADMQLENGDATDLIKFCKSNWPLCKIILFTAMCEAKAKEAAHILGVDHLLLKPFDLDDLEKLLS